MAELPLLIEPEDFEALRARHDNILLVDVSSPENYLRGHVPGAIHLLPAALQAGTPPAPGKLPDQHRLEMVLSHIGLSPERHVVAYDDEGGGWAARLLWTLEVVGHTRYSYLNGGIHAWREAGLEIETEINEPQDSHYPVRFQREPVAEIEDILPRLEDPDMVIWDARSAEEYRGERSGSARAGHIPGAVNIDWLELMDLRNGTRLLGLEDLRRRLAEAGITPEKEVITHCQTHHRSSLSWLVMKLLGFPAIRGYHGSWGEWGNLPELPVER